MKKAPMLMIAVVLIALASYGGFIGWIASRPPSCTVTHHWYDHHTLERIIKKCQ
jgi:hypothetical protein